MAKTSKKTIEYTPEQQAVINYMATPHGSKQICVINAFAGSGKTSVIEGAVKELREKNPFASILYLVFNAERAEEARKKLKKHGVDTRTVHSYALDKFKKQKGGIFVANCIKPIEDLINSFRNDEIDKLRHAATSALLERRDVIIVASVSCIYGLGNPEEYKKLTISLRPGMEKDRDEIIRKLIDIQYERNDIDFSRGTFRVRGDSLDIVPSSSSNNGIRIEFFGDEIDRIREFDVLTGKIIGDRKHVSITPASHFAASQETIDKAINVIEYELEERLKELTSQDKLVEAQRLRQRTNYDIEMIKEMGYCSGIENYSRILDGRAPGTPPQTLLDYFPDDYLMFIDESHVTLPQVRAMYAGDKSRKDNLVEYGFRLPSAYDNRPLQFKEFEDKINQVVFVSATPGQYEVDHSTNIAEQIIRPTGLIDPEIEIRPVKGQIDDLYGSILETTKRGFRTLVTTLTKKMAEDLTKYLTDLGVKTTYMHSDIDTIERMEIIRDLRLGKYDVLVGINLLREGLDIPEVALVAILDADKEGFLRSETSMI